MIGRLEVIDLRVENSYARIAFGHAHQRGQEIRSNHRIVVEQQQVIRVAIQRIANGDIVACGESEVARIADEPHARDLLLQLLHRHHNGLPPYYIDKRKKPGFLAGIGKINDGSFHLIFGRRAQ